MAELLRSTTQDLVDLRVRTLQHMARGHKHRTSMMLRICSIFIIDTMTTIIISILILVVLVLLLSLLLLLLSVLSILLLLLLLTPMGTARGTHTHTIRTAINIHQVVEW